MPSWRPNRRNKTQRSALEIMSTAKEWALHGLQQLKDAYIELEKKKQIKTGMCFLLKPISHDPLADNNVLPVTSFLQIPDSGTHRFWRSLGRCYPRVIEEFFGSSAVVRKYSRSQCLIFKTDGMDENLLSTSRDRLATATDMALFDIHVPSFNQGPPRPEGPDYSESPRRSPRKHASSQSTFSASPKGLKLIDTDGLDQGNNPLLSENWTTRYTKLKLERMGQWFIHDGEVYVENKWLPRLVSRTGQVTVSAFMMASNAFREFIKDEMEEDEDEVDDEEAGPRRKRVSPKEQLKFLSERCGIVNSNKLEDMNKMGGEEYLNKRREIWQAIIEKEKSYLHVRSLDKKNMLYLNDGNTDVALALESKTGWDIAPLLDGKIRFSDLRAAKHTNDLILELQKRERMPAVARPTFTQLKKALLQNERDLLRGQYPTMPESELDGLAKVFKVQSQAVFAMEE